MNLFSVAEGFTESLLFFPVVSCMFFANGNAVCAVPVFKEVKTPTSSRIRKIALRTELLVGVIYLTMGIFGYLSFPGQTPKLIVFRDSIFSTDIVLTIGKILLAVSLVISFATSFGVIRISGLKLLLGERSTEEISKIKHMIFTFVILMISTTIVTFYDKIISLISIIGGFVVIIINFFAVGYLYIKGNDLPKTHYKNILMFVTVLVLLLVGWTGGIISVVNSFRDVKE